MRLVLIFYDLNEGCREEYYISTHFLDSDEAFMLIITAGQRLFLYI